MCCCWMQDDGVARELPSEVWSMKISRSNDERICCRKDKWCMFLFCKEKKEVVELGFFFFQIFISRKSTQLFVVQCTQRGRVFI